MKRIFAMVAVAALAVLTAIPASAKQESRWAVQGEARALELAIGGQGLTLGFSATSANSTPSVTGVGSGQCDLVGEVTNTEDVPCSDGNTEHSEYPGNEGDSEQSCAGALPAPFNEIIQLNLVCGSSHSTWKNGPSSTNVGKVGELGTKNPLDSSLLAELLPADPNDPVNEVVDQLIDALTPIISETPAEIQTALENILAIVTSADDLQAVKAEIGPSGSNVTSKGDTITVSSTGAAARIGLVGLPTVDAAGLKVDDADPLKNGLVIIEVGPSAASATLSKGNAAADSAASASIVTIKIRDITKTDLTYIEVPVSPGESVTVLEGTPLESTITAAKATTDQGDGTAVAAADAVRLDLLKGVSGGIQLGLSRTAAAVSVEAVVDDTTQEDDPEVLPVTGGAIPFTGLGVMLMLGGLGAFIARRRFVS